MEPEKIISIRDSFLKLNSRRDLLKLMNEVKPEIFGKDCHPFELKQLTWHSNPKLSNKRYAEFTIRKKNGSERRIHAPVAGLKAIQKVLAVILQCVYEPHPACMGFVWNKSIVDNARLHVGSRYVYNIDLKDFFPSIDQARVWKCLQLEPFRLHQVHTAPDLTEKDFDINFLRRLFKMLKKRDNSPYAYLSFKEIHLMDIGEYEFLLSSGEKIYYRVVPGVQDNLREFSLDLKKSEAECLRERIQALPDIKESEIDTLMVAAVFRFAMLHHKLYVKKDNRDSLCNLIAAICCTEMQVERLNESNEWVKVERNVIPQGAPTSPVITNIICRKLDHKLNGVAKRFGLKYSRYADDITFSSMHNVFQEDGEFLTEMNRIITEQGFHIQQRKTRLQKDGFRKEVTGLLVHDKVNVPRKFVKELRMWLYMWEKYGNEKASNNFISDYVRKHGGIEGNIHMPNVIKGKLNYLSMVKSKDDPTVLALLSRFEELTRKYDIVEKLISQWELGGIEVAMKNYLDDTRNDY